MADFGGGLDLAQPGLPVDSGTLPQAVPAMDAPGPASDMQPAPGPQTSPMQSFGSSLVKMLPGAHYDTPDPQSSALDQSASLLEQRVKRANSIATNPLAQLFAPEAVAAARTFVPQAAEQLQKIEQQKSAIKAGRVQAETLGLAPGDASDQATQEDRLTIAQSKALKGDMRAFQGIQAVAPERAAAIAPQVYETVASHLSKAQLAFDSLSGMENEGQYRAKVNQLRQDGTLTDLESLGMKLPPTFEAFNASKAAEGRALREARIGINTIGQKLEERNTYQPMEKKEQDAWTGRHRTVYGDVADGKWSRNATSNTPALVTPGIATVDDLGKTGAIGSADLRKEIGESFKLAVPTAELEKIRTFSRTYQLAEPTAEQRKRGDVINTNPNVQQGIAEGLASMLRGGSGGATGQLLKIEVGKRGVIQGLIDKVKTEYAGALNELSGKDLRPYLTKLTQEQQREVLDGLKQWNDASIDDRAKQIARRAGAAGFTVADLGLGKDETAGAIGDAVEEGRQAQIAAMRPNFQPIGGGDGAWQVGAQRPGAGAATLPPGSQPANQLPGAAPLLTPVQQAGTNPPAPQPNVSPGGGVVQQPGPPQSSPPGSGGGPGQPPNSPAPITIAGQQVSVPLPPGLSPTFVSSLQRIESGNERDPWTAGAKGTSASGALQFIDKTWRENRPAGAPDRAALATPAQQAQAFATLTAKNAQVLKANNVPVNDTTMYMAHNLGAIGATSLLGAKPTDDARTVVGETVARNNPLFFKGKPNVLTVLGRYQAKMAEDISNDVPRPPPTPGGAAAAASLPGTTAPAAKPGLFDAAGNVAIEMAPAIGGTIGGVGGMAVGGPVGGFAGGAAGSAAGQALKDYLQGRSQSPAKIAEQAALGGVLGVTSVARPVLAAAGRVIGSGAIEAGADAAEHGVSADTVDAGVRGAAEGLGGEAFGRALGMAGHKVYSLFAPDARKAVQAAAKKYADAEAVLKSEPNRIPGPNGTEIPNPKFLAAEQAHDEAETAVKDMMPHVKMDEVAYAHKVSSEAVPLREAQVSKPGELEQQRVGAGYQQLETEVGARGVGAPKAAPKLVDGPIAAVAAGKVSAKHAELADHVEMAITAPAANWQAKWNQLKDARSDLLQAERDALTSTATGRTKTANDMRTLADTVRKQQEKAATYVFGPKEGPEFMARLKVLDTRYRNLMEATNGGDLAKAAALKGEAGRDADRKFRAFAHDDPAALQAWAAMRRAGPNVEGDVKNLVAVERIPYLGKLYSAAKLAGSFNSWMRERVAGNPAKFSDFINLGDSGARTARNVAGSVGARATVQGDVLNGAAP